MQVALGFGVRKLVGVGPEMICGHISGRMHPKGGFTSLVIKMAL